MGFVRIIYQKELVQMFHHIQMVIFVERTAKFVALCVEHGGCGVYRGMVRKTENLFATSARFLSCLAMMTTHQTEILLEQLMMNANMEDSNYPIKHPDDNYDYVHGMLMDNMRDEYDTWVDRLKQFAGDWDKVRIIKSKINRLVKRAQKYGGQ